MIQVAAESEGFNFERARHRAGRIFDTTRESLATVQVPVGIRWGGADTINPYDADTRPYLEHIPTASGCSAITPTGRKRR